MRKIVEKRNNIKKGKNNEAANGYGGRRVRVRAGCISLGELWGPEGCYNK